MGQIELNKWSVPILSALLVAACGTTAAPRKQADVQQVEKIIIEGTNQFRAGESRVVLRTNAELEKAAREFAEYMSSCAMPMPWSFTEIVAVSPLRFTRTSMRPC